MTTSSPHGPRYRWVLLAVAGAAIAALGAGAPSTYTAFATPGGAGSPGTAHSTPPRSTPPLRGVRPTAYVETRLFFGTARPDGGPAVTDAQFAAFIDDQVTPAFPEGLTVQDGRGQWRDSHHRIERERSHELVLLYPKDQAEGRGAAVERIRAAYVRRYAQDSVARLDEDTLADF
jgi:hypothetical protein